MTVLDITKLEDKIDKAAAGATAIDMSLGGIQFKSMIELMEFAKLMAVSGCAVPPHLRGNPGACLAVCTKALRFGFDPFSLAEHSYSMVKSQKVDGSWQDVETIAYDSFVIRAIIQAHAKITGPLDYTYEGEGDDRKCTVTATPNDGSKPRSLTGPTIGKIKANIGKNDKGKLKGSPLWEAKPDQQLGYDTGRDYCRLYHPEILMGWYDKDELEEYQASHTVTVEAKPEIGKRLGGQKGRGFSQDGVAKALEHQPAQTLDAIPKTEAVAVEVAATPHPVTEEQKPLALDGDAETEIAAKKQAVLNCETKADLTALVAGTTKYLKDAKRTDLLADFLSVAAAREKRLKD